MPQAITALGNILRGHKKFAECADVYSKGVATLANPEFTFLETTKQFNADFLITYLVHPGTAIYVGYNSDLLNPALAPDPNTGILRFTRNGYMNDSRQFFVKASYLYRF